MAIPHGKASYVQIDSHNLTTYCDNVDFSNAVDMAETSCFGQEAKTYLSGQSDGTLALSGKWDPTTTVNETQTLSATGTVSGGQYKLSFDGSTTADLAFNASLAAIQSAVDGLASAQGAGQIVATGGVLPGTPVVFTFSGSAWAGSSVPLMTVLAGTSPLSGGGSYGIVQTVAGTGGPDKVLQALVGAETASTWVYAPAGRGSGVGSGNVKYSGSGFLTSYKVTSPIGGIVAWTADLQIRGAITRALL